MRLLASLLVLAPSLAAQLVTLAPLADATTDSSLPAVNFGSSPELNFGKVFSPTPPSFWRRGHVLFDVSAFGGLVPTRATFHWYQSQAQGAGCLDVSLHNVTAPWAESTVTWQTQPAFDPTEVTRVCVGDVFALGWKRFNVTSLVQAWLDGSVPNLGFVIRDPMEITAGASRPGLGHSREYTNPALQPYLELDFAMPFGAGCTTHALMPWLDVSGGSATMGQTLQLRTSDLLPGSFAFAVFGLSNTTSGAIPLPLSLGVIGFPNCSLNVELGILVTIGIAPASTAVLPFVVPTAPAFSGQSLYTQVFALTPVTDLEATNGLAFRVWL